MGRKLSELIFGSLVFALVGCSGSDGGPSFVRWPVGLHVVGQGVFNQEIKAYKQVAGGAAVEQKGTIGSGSFAGQSSGTLVTTRSFSSSSDWLFVGETRSNNPLIPGWEKFGEVPVALVEARYVNSGVQTNVTEVSVYEEPQGQKHVVQSQSSTYEDRVTSAESFGLAGDEYIVEIDDLSLLWDPRWQLAEMFWKGSMPETWSNDLVTEYRKLMASMTYLGRANPKVGQVWVHPSGHTIYRAVAQEPIDIGGRTVTAVKIEARAVSDLDTLDVLNQCVYEVVEGKALSTVEGTPSPKEGDDRHPQLHLDPGCEGAFMHRKVGYEWWYNNVLVKEEATHFDLEIVDFGYEWVESQGGELVWRKSEVKTPNAAAAGATPFVQFKVTKTTSSWQATKWEVLNFSAY